MYAVTPSYLDAIRALSKTERLRGVLRYADGGEIPLTESVISMGTVSINRSCVEGEALQFGSAILGQLKISLLTKESRYRFYDAKIELTYGLRTADGWFDLPLGCFTVGETDRKNSVVQLVAYDNILALDKGYGDTILYGTPYEISKAVCEACGLVLGLSEEAFLALPNGAEVIQIDASSGCGTFRDAMKIVAQLTGTFVVADGTGAIVLHGFKTAPVCRLEKTHRYKLAAADYVCNYVGLRIKSSTGEFSAYNPDIESGLEMSIEDAPAWDYGQEETLQARADALCTELTKIIYTPSSITMPGDPAIQCGDMLEMVTDDGAVNTLVTETTWKFHGKMTVKSAGVNPYLKAAKTKKPQIVRQLEAEAEENELIFYSFTNQEAISVGEDPAEISRVTFVTTIPTSAMFVAQLPLIVEAEDVVNVETVETETEYPVEASSTIIDADGNPVTLSVKVANTDTTKTVIPGSIDVQIEYYLLGTRIDYELVASLPAGHHALALFYPLENLEGKTSYQWQVKIKVVGGTGTVTVPRRGLRATVTGQGMAGTGKWDGTINIEDSILPLPLSSKYRLRRCTENVSVSASIQDDNTINETTAPFTLQSRLLLGGGYMTEVTVDTINEEV